MYVFCLSCPSATFALQHAVFVPREWLATKDFFLQGGGGGGAGSSLMLYETEWSHDHRK